MRTASRALLALGLAARAATLSAQSDTSRIVEHLFVRSDLYVLGAFAAGTVLMFPLDRHLASVIRDEDLIANENLKRVSSAFRFFGGPGPFVIGGTMYVAGRVGHIERAADLAVHGTEAVVVGLGTSFALKAMLGRARPYISADTNPRNFGLGRGFNSADYESFPSGHSTAAFAAAAAVSSETAEWWPRTKWVIGPVMYTGASLVGLSRMYEDKHWASDVVMGAAVGVFAGLKTVRFNHTHVGNRIDRWLLGRGKNASFQLLPTGDRGIEISAHVNW
jgi:membrane-associated phospholipid phosphatase